MNGKWDHSTKPSTYKLLDKNGEIIYNGSFKDCMEKLKEINQETLEPLFQKGYNRGLKDGFLKFKKQLRFKKRKKYKL